MKANVMLAICLLFISCKRTTPETILGLKLGMPCDFQIQELKSKKVIIHDDFNSDNYYEFWIPSIRAYIRDITYTNSESVEILGELWLAFANAKCASHYEYENSKMNYYLNVAEVESVLSFYKQKYGTPIISSETKVPNFQGDQYKWKKGDMEIIATLTNPIINYVCKGSDYKLEVSYKYKDKILKNMKEGDIQFNKKF